MTPLENLLQHFPDARKRGRVWEAHCTAHQDRKASLSIAEGQDGRVVLHCHAGCEPQAVLAPLGLTMSELFSSRGDPSPEPERVYQYRNESGELLYEKLRYVPKRFNQRRPVPGGYEWNLDETPRVLYNLPALLKSAPEAPVLIVEGEKDVETLARLGFVATTNVEGAAKPSQRAKWRDEYTTWLAQKLPGRRFVVIPDNDPPGLAHGEHVVAALTTAGLRAELLKLPDLPEKGDVSDWFAAGGTAEKLSALLQPRPPRLSLLTFAEVCEMPEPVWQVEQLFEEQTLVEWFGVRGSAKSLTVLDLALTNCKGEEGARWCGRRILKTGPVIWVNADGGRGMIKRLKAWRSVHGGNLRHPFLILGERDKSGETRMGRVRLNIPYDVDELLDQILTLPSRPALIVIDTLSRSIPGVDENQQGPMTLVTDQCHRLRAETGASVHLIHHANKDGVKQRGSDVVPNEADYVIRVTMEGKTVCVLSDKARDGEKFQPFELCLQPAENSVILVQKPALFATGDPAPASRPRRETAASDLLALLADMPDSTTAALAQASGAPETSVRRWLKELFDAGLIKARKGETPPGGGRPIAHFRLAE